MKIKVCGMTDADNMDKLKSLNPDYVGFIFYPKSPRFVKNDSVFEHVPKHIKKTGVFVNVYPDRILDCVEKYKLDAVQLHGKETPEDCKYLKSEVEVLKAFGVDEQFDFKQLNAYADHVDYFLFDTKTVAHGGSGQTFDWSVLDSYKLDVPFFLSGGLSLDNIAEVKNIKHQDFYGVDLNSKFEIEPGLKDIDKLKQAFALLNNI